MKRILLTPETAWQAALKAARAELSASGGVVLVAKTSRARRHLKKVHREFRFPRRHDPASPPETWPLRSNEVSPVIYVDQDTVDRVLDPETGELVGDPATGAWHLLLVRPGVAHPPLNERAVPEASD